MAHVLISISHRHHSPFVLFEHQELSVADLAYFTGNFIAVFQFNRAGEGSRAHTTVVAVKHGTELAGHSFLQLFFARETVGLLVHYFVTRCVVFHLEFKYDLVRIEGMRRAEYTYCHDLLHFASLFARQPFVQILNL